TAHRESQEDGRCCRGHLGQIVRTHLGSYKVGAIPRRYPEKCGGDVTLHVGTVVIPSLAVLISACDLLNYKTIVRHVGVERVDDPVAISPYIADRTVTFQTARLAVPR